MKPQQEYKTATQLDEELSVRDKAIKSLSEALEKLEKFEIDNAILKIEKEALKAENEKLKKKYDDITW